MLAAVLINFAPVCSGRKARVKRVAGFDYVAGKGHLMIPGGIAGSSLESRAEVFEKKVGLCVKSVGV